MTKYFWLKALCVLVVAGSPLCADYSADTQQEHVSIEEDQLSEAEYSQYYEKRQALEPQTAAEDYRLNSAFKPDAEVLEAIEMCQAEKADHLADDSDQTSLEMVKKSSFVTTHPDANHYVIAVTLPYGDPVQLEDGSVWNIYSGDGYKTLNWLTTDDVYILPNRNTIWNTMYPYQLMNLQTGVSVQTGFSTAPWKYGEYAKWIRSVDYYNCQIVLNDYSVWNVAFSDAWILDSFTRGQYVIMGLNDFPANGLGSNILINFHTNQYVYATCIYY